jgi:tRNA threonylcarbamoyladenosine biosynthesis protein TsaB
MSLILNIFTALETASVCISSNGIAIESAFSENQKDHAGWIHTAINELLTRNNFSIKDLEAIGVCIGPGSYTGLRIGLATAKGLSYALNIPLISVDTLSVIAYAVKEEATDFICPMIDARRMEVFTALYNKELNQISAPAAMIIDDKSYSEWLLNHKILFCGNGSKKLQNIISTYNASFSETSVNATHLSYLSFNMFQKKEFSDIAYLEPFYIKDFFSFHRKD